MSQNNAYQIDHEVYDEPHTGLGTIGTLFGFVERLQLQGTSRSTRSKAANCGFKTQIADVLVTI